ncbi:unnamed protein product [Pieris macdunnoughi]|uniref:Uncharacterized protein n=1 Tax=Pieris macdunnoughi TaxID=345717 RepID=A0A821XYV4_9NEOP|nr:unnamed protein product [Pieris macdunnoughi]
MTLEGDEPAGCVNRAFEGVDDGFQTIDLRTTIRRNGHYQGEEDTASQLSPEERALRCGWGLIRPRWLQRFRTAKWALFWLCWAGAIQGVRVFADVLLAINMKYEFLFCVSSKPKAATPRPRQAYMQIYLPFVKTDDHIEPFYEWKIK